MDTNISCIKIFSLTILFCFLCFSCQKNDETLIITENISGDEIKIYSSDFAMTKIVAENPKDYYNALGFVHAKQAIWQMEFRRRMAIGTLSEIFGKSAEKIDIFMRSFDFKNFAQRSLLAQDDETKNKINQYISGINNFLESKPSLFNHLLFGEKYRRWQSEDIYILLKFYEISQNSILISKLDSLISNSQSDDNSQFKEYLLGLKEMFLEICANPKGEIENNIFHKNGDSSFTINFSKINKLQLPNQYLFTQFHVSKDDENKYSLASYFIPGLPFPIAKKSKNGATLIEFIDNSENFNIAKYRISSDGNSVIDEDNNLIKLNSPVDSLIFPKSSPRYYRGQNSSGNYLMNFDREFEEGQYYLSLNNTQNIIDISLLLNLNDNDFIPDNNFVNKINKSNYTIHICQNKNIFRINQQKKDTSNIKIKELERLLNQTASLDISNLNLIISSKKDLIAREIVEICIPLIKSNKKLLTEKEISYLDSLTHWDGILSDDDVSKIYLEFIGKIKNILERLKSGKHDKEILKLMIESYKFAVKYQNNFSFEIALPHITKDYTSDIDFITLKNIKFVASENTLRSFYNLVSRSSRDTTHYGSVFNFTFNTGNDLMLTVLFGGQSEEFTSINYNDQTYLWSLGAYSEINFSKNIEQFENLKFLIKKK